MGLWRILCNEHCCTQNRSHALSQRRVSILLGFSGIVLDISCGSLKLMWDGFCFYMRPRTGGNIWIVNIHEVRKAFDPEFPRMFIGIMLLCSINNEAFTMRDEFLVNKHPARLDSESFFSNFSEFPNSAPFAYFRCSEYNIQLLDYFKKLKIFTHYL